MLWSYGIMTVPARRADLFPRTLASLREAGFDRPRLFVDGDDDGTSWATEFGLEVSCRYPPIRVAPAWALALGELYLRRPDADRYAVFQDDFVTCRHLREYLERCPYPEKGYLNLWTYSGNQKLAPAEPGWFLSNQTGKGAQALVFSRPAVVTLLTAQHFVKRMQPDPGDPERHWQAVDGGIVEAFKQAGWQEWVHNPTLVYHLGWESTIAGKGTWDKRPTLFRGEDFDARGFLQGCDLELLAAAR